MNHKGPLSRRASSTNIVNPYSRNARLHPRLQEPKYITKDEFDEILEKQFQNAVSKLEEDLSSKIEKQFSCKIEQTNESLAQLEEELLKKMEVLTTILPNESDNNKQIVDERDYFRDQYIKCQNSTFSQYAEFSKIIAEYQKIIITLINSIINKQNIPEDTSRSLHNIGILQKTKSQESVKIPKLSNIL
jgi:hypothetical protein